MRDLSKDQSPLSAALRWIDAAGAASNVTFIVDSGTLLGLLRDDALLPGDVDVDVSVVDAHALGKLVRSVQVPFRIWRYNAVPYKLELYPPELGGLSIDVKRFFLHGASWVSPAIGAVRASERKSGLRRLLRPAWRWALRHGDAGRLPMRLLTRADVWSVPRNFFDDTKLCAGLANSRIPTDKDGYLTYRYGDWHTPRTNWVSWRDDGGYRLGASSILADAIH